MSMRNRRGAFTLVELLVVMSIVVLLSALTLAVLVNMGERDGTTDAAGLTRQWFMIAKNRAARDHAPRGLRLVVGIDPNNPAKTNAQWVTELQYIEQPTTFVPTIANPAARPPYSPLAPCVRIVYSYDPAGNQLRNASECWIDNLEPADAAYLQNAVPGGLLVLPDLRNSAENGPYTGRMFPPASGSLLVAGSAPGTGRLRMRLDPFPDVPLGATGMPSTAGTTEYLTFNFGVTPPPQSIVGEPPLQLPKGICIDLNASVVTQGGGNIDILFTPSGHVVPMGGGAGVDGMIHLWHRDYTKIPGLGNPLTVIANPPLTFDLAPFQNGGEQQLVSIRCKTGALGQFPVKWPNPGGQYNPGEDAYTFARNGATQP